jgi:hypothetical protein
MFLRISIRDDGWPAAVAVARLKACGWGLKRIARHLGCSHHTVKDYVAAGGVKPFKSPERPKLLDGLEGWLRERFIRHRGNADVVDRGWPSEGSRLRQREGRMRFRGDAL